LANTLAFYDTGKSYCHKKFIGLSPALNYPKWCELAFTKTAYIFP